MGHIPFGYRIENGGAVADENAAGMIRKLYANYLSGMSLETAAKEAGINARHGAVKRLLINAHYLGDDFYPAIIDADIYDNAKEELQKRAVSLGRTNRVSHETEIAVPTRFFLMDIQKHFDFPAEQAEYVYSRIECEVDN